MSELRHILHDFCFCKYEEELCKSKIIPGASVAWCRRPALSVTHLVYPPSEIHWPMLRIVLLLSFGEFITPWNSPAAVSSRIYSFPKFSHYLKVCHSFVQLTVDSYFSINSRNEFNADEGSSTFLKSADEFRIKPFIFSHLSKTSLEGTSCLE